MADTITLRGEEIYDISIVQEGKDYDEKSKRKGQKFSTFVYNGIVFPVEDSKSFLADLKAGRVKKITLIKRKYDKKVKSEQGVETVVPMDALDFGSYINKEQWSSLQQDRVEDAKVDFQINRFKQIETTSVTEAEIDALLQQVP